jgi:hypothetical protein
MLRVTTLPACWIRKASSLLSRGLSGTAMPRRVTWPLSVSNFKSPTDRVVPSQSSACLRSSTFRRAVSSAK